jgi:hypothetical protein
VVYISICPRSGSVIKKPEKEKMTVRQPPIMPERLTSGHLRIPLAIHLTVILLFIAITVWNGPVEAYVVL